MADEQALGFDLACVDRFASFSSYSPRVLQRVFSPKEISYSLELIPRSLERFAVRFAAKEAFYKALCMLYPERNFSFFLVCRSFSLMHRSCVVALVDWEALSVPRATVLVSVSHESNIVGAVVLLRCV